MSDRERGMKVRREVLGKEHVGGFWIVRAEDLDVALGWARRAARAVAPLPIEVRPFQHGPA